MIEIVQAAYQLKKEKQTNKIDNYINVSSIGVMLKLNEVEVLVLDKIVNSNMSNEEIKEILPREFSMTVSNVKRIVSKIMTLAKIEPRNRQSLYRFCLDFQLD